MRMPAGFPVGFGVAHRCTSPTGILIYLWPPSPLHINHPPPLVRAARGLTPAQGPARFRPPSTLLGGGCDTLVSCDPTRLALTTSTSRTRQNFATSNGSLVVARRRAFRCLDICISVSVGHLTCKLPRRTRPFTPLRWTSDDAWERLSVPMFRASHELV